MFKAREGSFGGVGGNNGSICGKHDGYFSIKSLPALPTALTSPPSQVNPSPVWITGSLNPAEVDLFR